MTYVRPTLDKDQLVQPKTATSFGQRLNQATAPAPVPQSASIPKTPTASLPTAGIPTMAPTSTTVTRTSPTTPTTTMAPAPAGSTVTRTAAQQPSAGAPGQPFTDLRSRTVLPTGGTSQGIGGQVSQIAQELAGHQFQPFNPIAAGEYNPAGDTSQVRQRILEQLQGAGRMDRGGLAAQAFDLIRTRSDDAFNRTLRDVGQRNAALGRIGSGMVTNDLMDVTAQRERDLSLAARDLSLDAAGKSLEDRLAQLQASQGVFDQFSGADRADAGFRMDLRNEGRAERQAGLNYGLDTFGQRHGLLNSLAGLEGQRFQQDLTGRNEIRAEREFQQGQSQQAIDNALRERLTEEQIFGNDYDRWLRGAATFGSLGFGDTGSGAAMQGAGQLGQQAQAGRDALADFGQNWSYVDWARRNGAIVN
jgi:hypothetical protein